MRNGSRLKAIQVAVTFVSVCLGTASDITIPEGAGERLPGQLSASESVFSTGLRSEAPADAVPQAPGDAVRGVNLPSRLVMVSEKVKEPAVSGVFLPKRLGPPVEPEKSRSEAFSSEAVDVNSNSSTLTPQNASGDLSFASFDDEALPSHIADFTGDPQGVGGYVGGASSWPGVYVDTLVQSQGGFPSPSPLLETGDQERSVTTFENGYIPAYGEPMRQVDSDANVQRYANNVASSRFPESWTVPPGQRRVHLDPVPMYDRYPGQTQSGYATSQYSPYEANRSQYNDPDGPYGYNYDGLDSLLTGGNFYEDANFKIDGGIPLFTRQFDPNEAHLKAGPFYFQALHIETGALYSDYDGPQQFRRGEEDGWLGFVGFRFRSVARITPSLYFSADGELIYLIGANELGFRSGFGGGPFLRLVYEKELGRWDFMAYAEFGTNSFNDFFGADAYESAGRYSFGFLGYNADSRDYLYDPFLYATVGVEASTLVRPDWRLTLDADHTDYWYIGDSKGVDGSAREHFGALYSAVPGRIPFSPWASYDVYTNDQFDSLYHTIYTGGSGRLTENVSVDGRAGYLWTSGLPSEQNHWLWNTGLRHRISERTTHGFRVGQDFFLSDFSNDSVVSEFLQYYISHQLTERIRLDGFAQWSSDEFLSGNLVGGEYDSEIYGMRADFTLSDRISANVGYRYEERTNTLTREERERYIIDANLNVRLGPRTTSYFRYQFENDDFFDEDLYMAGVRRNF
jgi:hypothetical protein